MSCRKIVGSGSYGTVYDQGNGKVTKEMELVFENTSDQLDIQESILREICFLSSIYHPFILPIDNVQRNDRILSFDLEKFGQDIYKQIFEMSYNERVKILPQIIHTTASVLKDLDSLNLCHGDLKPPNILYDVSKNEIRIIDFGGVKHYPELNDQQTCTAVFASPEHLFENELTISADIFSLGLITKFLLYKSVEEVEDIENAYNSKNEKYPLYEGNIMSSLSRSTENLLIKCENMLIIDPEYRPQPHEILSWSELYKASNNTIERKDYLWAFVSNNGYVPNRWNRFKHLNLNTREVGVEYIFHISDKICFWKINPNAVKIPVHAVWIFDMYMDTLSPDYSKTDKFQLILLSCIILASSMDEIKTLDSYTKDCNEKYTTEEIINMVWTIFSTLNYQLFFDNFVSHLEYEVLINPTVVMYMMINRDYIAKTCKQKVSIYNKIYEKPLDLSKINFKKIHSKFAVK